MTKRTRFELRAHPDGGYTARRVTVDATEPLTCAVRLEVDAGMGKGELLALLPELLRIVAQANCQGPHRGGRSGSNL